MTAASCVVVRAKLPSTQLARARRWISCAFVASVLVAGGWAAGYRARGPVPVIRDRIPAADRVVGADDGAVRRSRSAFSVRYDALRQEEARSAGGAVGGGSGFPNALPVRGARLTSSFTPRRRHPVLRVVRPHWGVDLAAPAGTPVNSSGDGVVLAAVRNPTYGLVVDVSHLDGAYITRYAHLSSIVVRTGQRVRRGEMVGRVGSTGLSAGDHLHYEVFVSGRRYDPALLFDANEAAALLQ